VLWQAAALQGKVGHGVHRVADNNNDGVGRMLQYVFGNCFYNACVNTDQLFPCHARFAGYARGNNGNIGAGSFGIVVGAAGYLCVKAQ